MVGSFGTRHETLDKRDGFRKVAEDELFADGIAGQRPALDTLQSRFRVARFSMAMVAAPVRVESPAQVVISDQRLTKRRSRGRGRRS